LGAQIARISNLCGVTLWNVQIDTVAFVTVSIEPCELCELYKPYNSPSTAFNTIIDKELHPLVGGTYVSLIRARV